MVCTDVSDSMTADPRPIPLFASLSPPLVCGEPIKASVDMYPGDLKDGRSPLGFPSFGRP